MAYLGADGTRAIRNALKAEFPNLKFSVTKSSGNLGVDVNIMAGDVDFSDITDDRGNNQINIYHTRMYGDHKELFDKIVEIMKTAPAKAGGREWFDDSDSMTDYFHTAYYMHLEVGKWNKPYNFTGKKNTGKWGVTQFEEDAA